ncbi:MAG: ChaN family lipoprotein [Bdellovibrionaceae bacterium]|nr:ChaN family lipoprotein [Pseudobdellovibrionaceae bacterium]
MSIFRSVVFALISISFIHPIFATGAKIRVYDTQLQKFISPLDLFTAVPRQGQLVLGEEHYQEAIQKAEGDIVAGVLSAQAREKSFTICWEFLNYPDQKIINTTFSQFTQQLISITEVFAQLFTRSKPMLNYPYRHLFEVARSFKGKMVGINAPRKWKQVITKNGIAKLDKKLVPNNMELGGPFYKERFIKAISNHVSPEKVPNYFEAQSYTDSVMAESIQKMSNTKDLKFVVVGSFHSDFNDGLVAQLKKYNPKPTTSIKIIDITEFSNTERQNLFNPHPKYGVIADYIYTVDN